MTGSPDPLAEAAPWSYWHDRHDAGGTRPPLTADTDADLVVVGAGFTGLWTAITAKRRDPARDVLLLEGRHVGYGATGRNGGFVSDSLTHGLAHGLAQWPDRVDALATLGRENLDGLRADVEQQGIDADLRLTGKTLVATTHHQASALPALGKLLADHGEHVEMLDAAGARADVDSPTYLGALRIRSGGGTLDPAALAAGLRDWALRLGVRLHERTPVSSVEPGVVTTARGRVRARQVALATNAYPAPARRLRKYVVPVYDHVLVTEPLTDAQWAGLGWPERQGVTDAGNQFHYYRLTDDDRILWGGYDAVYHYGSRTDERLDRSPATFLTLAENFQRTFPQLTGLPFTHGWGGVIDTCSRFSAFWGRALGGRVAYSLGYTGLGVGASRFGAQVALDLLAAAETERTRLEMVRRRPLPFPPEPVRWAGIELTRRAVARADAREGRRGPWLRTLDSVGLGFDS
jgi:glycine/D-amino acid oxidase-like deaminating enzyme